MKRMQCESCNGRIIKIDDDIFECQSCGLRYSLASIKKMSVSIDYEGEINNLLNRADSFEASKDYIKAKEYLNKVLDFDSDNAEAKKRIERILIKEMYATFRISKAIIKPDQNIDRFLHLLKSQTDIVCDIYNEIKITSASTRYIPFGMLSGRIKCIWSAEAGHDYYETYTVYEKKYDSDLKRDVTSPVTKKERRTQYVPVSGVDFFKTKGIALASKSVSNRAIVKKSKLDIIVHKFVDSISSIDQEKLLNLNINDVTRNYEFNTYVDGIVVDFNVDKDEVASGIARIFKEKEKQVYQNIRGSIDADSVKNLNCNIDIINSDIIYVLLPVQIINYIYKNEEYVALFDLSSENGYMINYPIDKDYVVCRNRLEQKIEIIKKEWSIVIISLILYYIAFAAESEVFSALFLITTILTVALAGFESIYHYFDKRRSNKYIFDYRHSFLENSYIEFFALYTGKNNYSQIQSAMKPLGMTLKTMANVQDNSL